MKDLSFEEKLAAIVDGNHTRPFYCATENGVVETSHKAWLEAKAAEDPKDK